MSALIGHEKAARILAQAMMDRAQAATVEAAEAKSVPAAQAHRGAAATLSHLSLGYAAAATAMEQAMREEALAEPKSGINRASPA